MADFKVHTGRRRRAPSASQIEAFEKRKAGTKAEREAAANLYAPFDGPHLDEAPDPVRIVRRWPHDD